MTGLFFKIIDRIFSERRKAVFTTLKYGRFMKIGSDSFVYPCAKVVNTQRDPSKIIIGNKTHIRGELFLFGHGGRITIGDYCFIGEQSRIWSALNIKIGNGVLIAHNVNIHDNISHPVDTNQRYKHTVDIIDHGHPSEKIELKEAEVIIEDYAWIGFNSTIMKGVRIGKGAIVGACTLITKDVPDYAIMVGNPAKLIGYAAPKTEDKP